MAAPAFVATGTAPTGLGAACTPGIPAGMAAGHIMVAVVSFDKAATAISTPPGWQLKHINSPVINSPRVAVFWRAWQSGDSAPQFNFTDASGLPAVVNRHAQIYSFSGADTTNPWDSFQTTAWGEGNSTSPQAVSITAVSSEVLLLWFVGIQIDATVTAPSGMTKRTADTAVGMEHALCSQALSASGATGTRTGTLSTDRRWAAGLGALKPVPAASVIEVAWLAFEAPVRAESPVIEVAWLSFEAPNKLPTPVLKVYISGAWVVKPLKRWDGAQWVTASLKVWFDSGWL